MALKNGDVIADADGRALRVRVLDPADTLDLMEAAGDAAGNASWMRYAMLACSVSEINGVPVAVPTTKGMVRDVARKLGNAGIVALAAALFPSEDAEAAAAADEQVAVAKN